MESIIRDIIYSSINSLFRNQPELFTNTDETNMTEWNLGHHVANEISKYIFWLNGDIDITKRNHQNKRPDIIFHKRGINTLNFLVVEVKKNRNDRHEDISKLKEEWMSLPLKYRFGLFLNIWDINQYEAILLDQRNGQYEISDKTCTFLELPKVSRSIEKRKNEIMSLIVERERNAIRFHSDECEDLIEELDRQVINSFLNYKYKKTLR